MTQFLELLGFSSDDGRSYKNSINADFEFYFTEAETPPVTRSEIFISISIDYDIGEFLSALDLIGLKFDYWEHPRFYDVHIHDPAGRLWQAIINH